MTLVRTATYLLLTMTVLASPPQAQEPPADHCGGGTISGALMERPIAIQTGIGSLPQKVSTTSREAQAFYDQGNALLASYVWADAARSFHEALRRDPQLAMAELGLAKARYALDDGDGAVRRQAAAASKAAGATEKERRWIALFGQQLEAIRAPADQRASKHLAYKRSLDSLVAMDPSDAHAWVLRGNAEEDGAWGRGQFGGVASIAFYEAALMRDRNHIGAHHFLVHSYENIQRYEQSAAHGKVYSEAAPRVPHALHMYGHVLPRLGRWKDAQAVFERADRLHREFLATEKVGPEEEWHLGHNLHLLGTVQMRLGDIAGAEKRFEEAYAIQTRDAPRRASNAAPLLDYLLMVGRYDEALRRAATFAKETSPSLQLLAVTVSIEALAAQNRVTEARAELARAAAIRDAALAEVAATPYEVNRSRNYRRMMDAAHAMVDLRNAEADPAGNTLLKIADAYANTGSFDGWGVGLFTIERMAREAKRSGHIGLATALRARQTRIDPSFPSNGISTASR